jgi:hypothetical protein
VDISGAMSSQQDVEAVMEAIEQAVYVVLPPSDRHVAVELHEFDGFADDAGNALDGILRA